MKNKKIAVYLYITLIFTTAHIRWVFAYIGDRRVLAMPIILVILSILLIPQYLSGSRKKIEFAVIIHGLLFLIISLFSFDWTFGVESSVISVILFIAPIAALGAPSAFRYISESFGGRKVLFVLSGAMIVQTLWLSMEEKFGLSNFFRPNVIGTSSEWFFNNRYGVDRAKYSFSSPMTAGAWAWFCGSILIVLGGWNRYKPKKRLFFILTGFFAWFGILFCISRGPTIVAFLSLLSIIIVRWTLKTIVKYLLVLIVGVPLIYMLSTYFIDDDLAFSLTNIASDTFSASDEGNTVRISNLEKAGELISSVPPNGNGLHKISYLIGEDEINFENTFLNIVYGAGYVGVVYSALLIGAWLYGLVPLWFSLRKIHKCGPLAILAFAMGNGWFSYMFFYPCLREIELSIITFSILSLLLIKPWEEKVV